MKIKWNNYINAQSSRCIQRNYPHKDEQTSIKRAVSIISRQELREFWSHMQRVSKISGNYSNESTNQMQQFLRFIACRLNIALHVSGIPMPIIWSSTTAAAASGFTAGTWWQKCCWSWSGRPARPRPTALPPPRSNSKTRGCYCSFWAPDDGQGDAPNMLSSI